MTATTQEKKRRRAAILFKKQDGLCPYCDFPMQSPESGTMDHILPRSRGGKKGKNMVLVHKRCNYLKGAFASYDEARAYCDELMNLFAHGMEKGLLPKSLGVIAPVHTVVPMPQKMKDDYEQETLTF